jgi:hypothetical protein
VKHTTRTHALRAPKIEGRYRNGRYPTRYVVRIT